MYTSQSPLQQNLLGDRTGSSGCAQVGQFWTRIFNFLLVFQGLLIIGFAIYVGAKTSGSTFVWGLAAIGLFTAFVGFVGIKTVKRRSSGLSRFYSVLFCALLLFHAAVVIGFLAFEDKTTSFLQDLNGSGDNAQQIKDYIDNNRESLRWASFAVLIVETLTFFMSVCCSRKINALDDELMSGTGYSELDHVTLASSNSFGTSASANVSRTPQTDSRRQQMEEKYGHSFARRSDNY